jgi:2'-5' RNA ligase
MRLFAAIDIGPDVARRIEQVQKKISRDLNLSRRDVKWVRPDQIHLTLKFLGEVRDDAISEVCGVLTQTAAGVDGFDLQIRGVGVFGKPVRVVWAGIEACPALMKLQSKLENEFKTIGWKKESRGFTGHLTVCRVKNVAAGRKIASAAEVYEDEFFGSVSVDKLVLYESRLSPAGPEYSAACTAPLK